MCVGMTCVLRSSLACPTYLLITSECRSVSLALVAGAGRCVYLRSGTQGGLNCLTHVLPRCLPTPTEEADGGGAGKLSPGGVAPGPPSLERVTG